MTPEKRRMKPYWTGELAELLEVSQRTAIRMVDAGEFGVEGKDWWRTPGRKRRVRSRAVQEYIAHRS